MSSMPATSQQPAGAQATPPARYVFSATRATDGATTLSGTVPAVADEKQLLALAPGAGADGLAPAADLPVDFTANAEQGLRAVARLASGVAGFDGHGWWLSGTAYSPAERDAIVAALTPADLWTTRIDVMPPLDACRAKVTMLAGKNGILFASGRATLEQRSEPVLDELAADLKLCPQSPVHVQGYTDSDGAADANLILSVSRAEAVVNALIDRGIPVERLYAEGFGESNPIASNDTAAGKAQNRRIAFQIDAPE
jgi:outer membrane protein OmpA-like peptidoglycan-associated protein